MGWLKFDDYNYDYINSNVLISHDKVLKIHFEKDQVKNKSNDIVLNEEALEKLKAKYGDVKLSDFELLSKEDKTSKDFD